ncbi:hypothetical protein [Streptomyces sp. NPDC093600]|uniref:hypothetical protein n=1 Tax=Streptomyces sp. NPDC093600 TaxID=3366047 RepID=UPI0038269850
MPKNQSTAAQTARWASRSGGKYTEARRRATTSEAPRTPHVLRFLAEHSGNLYHLVGGIAAAWAHSGQRVLYGHRPSCLNGFEALVASADLTPLGRGRTACGW